MPHETHQLHANKAVAVRSTGMLPDSCNFTTAAGAGLALSGLVATQTKRCGYMVPHESWAVLSDEVEQHQQLADRLQPMLLSRLLAKLRPITN